ncbi:choice-of-anchor Q domain-containing protein [Hydrocoleum sp. CS-953]|uniref:choice-of-anchor Q domain-containing protein n=1 Tax=Hydrocoleum sp. CS-953 TaxID=1671698 RepID=UPI000B9BC432|nr:choice-of-anchor Q domain-containing protein [Hydrocoleum sp. CS-953]
MADFQEVNNIFIHPLLENSPAIDAGVNADAPTTDQLGNTRPVDGDNNGSEITDVGAVEFITASSEPETGDNNNNILTVTNNNDSGTGS